MIKLNRMLGAFSVTLAALAFSGCIPSTGGGKNEKTLQQLGVKTGGGAGVSGGSVVPLGLSNVDAFQQTLFPLIRADARTCKSCHSSNTLGIQPLIADVSPQGAWSAIESGSKVNLLSPMNSAIVLKVRSNHNCGGAGEGGCTTTGDAFQQAIANMAILVQPPQTTPAPSGGAGGTTIPGLSSLESFRQTLHPTLRAATCVSCHGDTGPQAPYAGSNLQNAHDSLVGGGLVDLSDPSRANNSGVVQKVRANHNCGGAAACTMLADTMASNIVTWRALMQPTLGAAAPPANGRVYSGQITMPGALGGMTPIVDPTKVYVEAEAGTLTNWATQSNSLAGNYQVITVANGGGNAANQNDANTSNRVAVIPFTVSQAATYRIWVRYAAPTTNDNSFFLKVDNGAFDFSEMGATANLNWTQIRTAGNVIRTFNLAAGNHTIEVRHREDGVVIDKFLITSDAAFTPTGIDGVGSTSNVRVLEWDVSALAGVAGVRFRIDVVDFDQSTYLFSRPRLVVANGSVLAKSVMILINNIYVASDSTFTVVDDEVAAPGGDLNNDGALPANLSLLVLKGSNPPLDKFTVSFERIMVR